MTAVVDAGAGGGETGRATGLVTAVLDACAGGGKTGSATGLVTAVFDAGAGEVGAGGRRTAIDEGRAELSGTGFGTEVTTRDLSEL